MWPMLFANAVLAPVITAGAWVLVMTMIVARRVAFPRLIAVYAFSGGVTLLAFWIPSLVWITEPWRWGLILIGMVRGCGFKWTQALVIVGVSILVVMLLFWSPFPMVIHWKDL